MAQYKVLELSFINNCMVEAGTVIEYDGEAGPNLEPIDPLDHDGNGKKGGSKPKADAE
jgi:hypothetical protein